MKQVIPSIIVFLCLVTVNPGFSQSPVRISNIYQNQEIAGLVRVELSSKDLSAYRKVSWCMDGELVCNVYDPPFTAEIDTRDFSNGRHELSVRALRQDAPVDRAAVQLVINNGEIPLNFLVSAPRRYFAEGQLPYHQSFIDAPHAVLKKNEEELYFFHNKGLMMHEREHQGVTSCFSGTLDDPLRTIERAGYVPEVWDKNGHSTQGMWLMSIHKIGENELIGFTHNESCYDLEKECVKATKFFSIGLGYSKDNGRNWTYCGDMLRTSVYGNPGGNNIKGVPYLLRNGWIYIYFWEFPEDGVYYPAVARAPVGEVIEAARKGRVVNWKKYRDGSWEEDGMTGLAGNVMSELDKTFNMHCQVAFMPAVGKYIMVTYEIGHPDIYLLASLDGLQWEVVESIRDHNRKDGASYPFFGDFYSDDGHEIDDDFYIYWARRNRELWGARVRLEMKE